ncbi:acylphosphatase [Salinibacterium sp. G-O1]|uniref:acylphosphatase n=1 Tax=Salinibacterium sp. G-O1 TaxID=3046208 RepID=UPI0024B91131|nr:acylphosphatase [Salinibacterium sp. G-O1]MDJ0333652.1 acylphosphatase [Salinibacterium sp. G-O1]
MVRKQAIVRGEVQGVGFRYFAFREATQLGLAGYVRNRTDGAVELEVEGQEAAVDRMLSWLKHGPASAVVVSLDVSDRPLLGETGFTIAH